MTASPLISVVVPNYNHARYLDQRLQSILNQTYRNIEVIILDDCSSDNSLEVISKYTNDPRVVSVIVNEKNSGNTFLQWDKGLHMAKGECVWIAESDDYCELNMLEELVTAFNKKRSTLLSYCTPELFTDSGKTWENSREGKNKYMRSSSYIRRYLINQNWPLNASCCLFRRDLALTLPDRYKTIEAAGDYMFWAELLCNRGWVAIVNRHLSKWRIHEDSVTPINARSGKLAIADKEIFDYLCSKVFVSRIRKKFALRYHIAGLPYHKIESAETLEKVYELWCHPVASELTFFDKLYKKVNEILFRYFKIRLSY